MPDESDMPRLVLSESHQYLPNVKLAANTVSANCLMPSCSRALKVLPTPKEKSIPILVLSKRKAIPGPPAIRLAASRKFPHAEPNSDTP